MTGLQKYVVGVKPKDKEEMILANDALNKSEEHKVVLLIPQSEFDKLQEAFDDCK